MGLDATLLGIQFFFLILIPEFTFTLGFKWAAGFNKTTSSIYAIGFWGAIILSSLISGKNNPDKFKQLIATPISTGINLAIASFIFGLFLGFIFGWIRAKFLNFSHALNT